MGEPFELQQITCNHCGKHLGYKGKRYFAAPKGVYQFGESNGGDIASYCNVKCLDDQMKGIDFRKESEKQ